MAHASNGMMDLGLEIVVEPDVVPKGTVDLRSLDAAPGTPAPPRRIEPDGRVFPIGPVAASLAPTELVSSAQTGIVPPPAVVPAGSREPDRMVTGQIALDEKRETAQVEALKHEAALGSRLRKKSSGIHNDTAMPPRPASASETSPSGRSRGAPLPNDDYETTLQGGIASPLWSLAKVTAALTFLFLATVLTYLYLNGLLPTGGGTPALVLNPTTSPVATPSSASLVAKTPEVAPVPTLVAADKAPIATSTRGSAAGVAVGVVFDGDAKPEAPKEVVQVPPAAKASNSEVGTESDFDINKVEQLRREGVLLTRAGKLDEALAKFEALLAIKPNDPDALFRKALIFHQKKDLKGAVLAYEAAAAVAAPRDARAFTNLGIVHETLGDVPSAKNAYERGLKHNPEDPDILTNLGRFKEDTDPKGALVLYDRALEANPRHAYARFHRAAVLAFALGQPEVARVTFLELASEETRVKGEALDALANLALQAGKPEDAVKLAKKAVEASPELDQARLRLGVALYASGDAQNSEKALKTFLERQPTSVEGWKSLGACYTKMDQLAEAKQAYEKALDLNKNDASTLYNYALCAERFGNFLFAIQEYEHVIAIDPRHWRALENIGRLYRRAGRTEKALEYFDKAIKVEAGDANLHLDRAHTLVVLKRDPEARAELKEFVRLAPTDPRAEQVRKAIDYAGELIAPNTEAPAGDRPRGF